MMVTTLLSEVYSYYYLLIEQIDVISRIYMHIALQSPHARHSEMVIEYSEKEFVWLKGGVVAGPVNVKGKDQVVGEHIQSHHL